MDPEARREPESSSSEHSSCRKNISVIILSAGLSQRMGAFKPLLPLDGRSAVERVIGIYQISGVTDIHVVVGHRAEEIRRAVKHLDVHWVLNDRYADGMFSSVLAGVRALPETCKAFFIHPVDIPLVRPHTVAALMRSDDAAGTKVLYPVFDGEEGHPPLIAAELIEAIRSWPGEGGLRGLLERIPPSQVQRLTVADEAILLDQDTPGAYRHMVEKSAERSLPSEAECRVLMEQIVGLPEAVVRHSKRVEMNAQALCTALEAAGVRLNSRLVRTAALLHDIARSKKDHAQAGADLLALHGFPRLSDLVSVHMDLDVTADTPLDEAQIVHLADKLASGDQVADLETRFKKKMNKYGKDSISIAAIAHRLENARRILEKAERLTGRSIADILNTPSPEEARVC